MLSSGFSSAYLYTCSALLSLSLTVAASGISTSESSDFADAEAFAASVDSAFAASVVSAAADGAAVVAFADDAPDEQAARLVAMQSDNAAAKILFITFLLLKRFGLN